MSDKSGGDAAADTASSIIGAGATPIAHSERQSPPVVDLDATSNRDSFLDRLEHIAANVVIMKVTTVIGTLESVIGADDTHRVTTIKAATTNQQVASLSINMALGDTSQLLSQGFAENETYMKMHNDAVQQARAVRQETVELLRAIYKDFRDMLKL